MVIFRRSLACQSPQAMVVRPRKSIAVVSCDPREKELLYAKVEDAIVVHIFQLLFV